jgi:hypothetical protein
MKNILRISQGLRVDEVARRGADVVELGRGFLYEGGVLHPFGFISWWLNDGCEERIPLEGM